MTAMALGNETNAPWKSRLARYCERVGNTQEPPVEGTLSRVVGLTLEATGCQAAIGSRCMVVPADAPEVEAEVVGFEGDKLYLMPIEDVQGVTPNARVVPTNRLAVARMGGALLGRVVNGRGDPLDGKGPIHYESRVNLLGKPLNPLSRQPIREKLDVGIRTINSLLSVGLGQRMGLFAGSGVGKSMLLGMMTRFTEADVTVVGLIGERGREVKDFVETTLGEDGMQRAVVVATPSDNSPLMRLHGAWLTTSIAEYFRDQGLKVLLLMDSLTRFAQAQREIALAIGEPPATKGYPPSVFTRLPQLVERAGNGPQNTGSITAFYTVLTESDDHNDPIADAARAILDGHVVLSRAIAESGIYPAIDVEASTSRALPGISDQNQRELIKQFRQLYATYLRNRDLIAVGAYQPGSDPKLDQAVQLWPKMQAFLQQDTHESFNIASSLNALSELLSAENGNATAYQDARTLNGDTDAGHEGQAP